MSFSEEALVKMFPKDEPYFTSPFHVDTDVDGMVHIYDAENAHVTTFCQVTQLPLDDDRALAAETGYWVAEANRIVAALNASYPRVG